MASVKPTVSASFVFTFPRLHLRFAKLNCRSTSIRSFWSKWVCRLSRCSSLLGLPNAMNAAWGGISEMNEISICISEGHKTTANILKRKAFTVSMAEAGQIIACDYVGIVSGNKVPDKFARAGFHATRSEFVDAPLIDELSVAVECKLKDYNPETCILRGEIVNVSVDERVLDQNGKVDASKVIPVIFDPFNNDYLKVGEKVGNAFSDGKALK